MNDKINKRKNYVRCPNCSQFCIILDELEEVRAEAYQEGARIQAEMDAKTMAELKEKIIGKLNGMKQYISGDITEDVDGKNGFNHAISEVIEIVKKIK